MTKNKRRILFVITSLVGGGAEKVLLDILSHLDEEKYTFFLVLFEKRGVHLPSIPPYVTIIDLKKTSRYHFFYLIIKLAFHLRKIKPDSVVSFMHYPNLVALLAGILSGIKTNLILTVHGYLSIKLSHERCSLIKKFFIKKLYKIPNYIVVPSKGVMDDLISEFKCNPDKIMIINHPIDIDKIEVLIEERKDTFHVKDYIIAVGRLTRQKDYPVLIQAYHLISDKVANDLVILGAGWGEDNLKEMAINLGLQKRIHFLGFQKNPYKFMRNASVFVLSSLSESFAIVIIEAMACGLPVISTDCPSGPREIITNGKNGILVEPANEKALADAMLTLLKSEKIRDQFSREGKKRAEDFKIDRILPEYEALFQ